MSQFHFRAAEIDDDAALRDRLAADVLPGRVALSFRREPNYFYANAVQGESCQVAVCVSKTANSSKIQPGTETGTETIVGVGVRCWRPAYINGALRRLGYLADLRLAPQFRRATLLARGYRYLAQLHRHDPIPLYYSLILQDNQTAIDILSSGRAGLPRYRSLGKVLTPALLLGIPRRALVANGLRCERAGTHDLAAVFAFWQQQLRYKQLAPYYHLRHWQTSALRDLSASDIYLLRCRRQLVGVAAAWDQSAFRQTHVHAYHGLLAVLKPGYNALARCGFWPPLPPPGGPIKAFYLSHIAVQDNDPELFRVLLRTIYRDRYRGPWHYIFTGLHERDPLTVVLRDYPRIDAAGQLYVVHFADGAAAYAALDQRVPYIDVSLL